MTALTTTSADNGALFWLVGNDELEMKKKHRLSVIRRLIYQHNREYMN